MNGLLIVAGLVILLVLALGPAHRRAHIPWRPGFETRHDRDLARLKDDLSAAQPGGTLHGPRYPSVQFDPQRPPSDPTLAA